LTEGLYGNRGPPGYLGQYKNAYCKLVFNFDFRRATFFVSNDFADGGWLI
jgi:hypothetical protein